MHWTADPPRKLDRLCGFDEEPVLVILCVSAGQDRALLDEDELETVARVLLGLVDGLNNQLIAHGDEKLLRREIATATAMLQAYFGRRSRRSA